MAAERVHRALQRLQHGRDVERGALRLEQTDIRVRRTSAISPAGLSALSRLTGLFWIATGSPAASAMAPK